jgi:hypothetical protein
LKPAPAIGKGKLDAMGFARLRDTGNARIEIDKLQALRDEVAEGADRYWVEQIDIQREAAQAWVAYAEGIKVQAMKLCARPRIAKTAAKNTSQWKTACGRCVSSSETSCSS